MPAITDIQTGHGATFVTGAFSGQIVSITPGAITREVVDTTHLGSSNATTRIPGDLYTAESWEIEFQFVPGTNNINVGTTAASCTITFPTYGGDWSAGATLTGSGFFSSFQPGQLANNELMMATGTWQWSGAVTWTSATT